MNRNLYLIGFSGTGKSAVAEVLAGRLGWARVDTDAELIRRFGKPIDRVFAEDGESAFRAAEREVVAWTAHQRRLVVSLGGGAFVDPASRALVRQHRSVRLVASPEEILRRLAADRDEARPMLDSADPLGRIRELLARRDAVYSEAEISVDTEGLTPDEVAERVLDLLGLAERATLPAEKDR